jgi:hypothetical protein
VDDRWRGGASGGGGGGGGGGSSCAARSKRRVHPSRQIERRGVSSEEWMAAASVGVLEVVAIVVCVV